MIKIADFIDGYKNGKVPASTMIKMAAFKDELEKKAVGTAFGESMGVAFADATKNMLPMMLVGGGMSAVATAIHEGIKALEGKYEDYKLEQEKLPAYAAMLRQHPDLSEKSELTKVYFDALWHYSPMMAQEPLSAGAYIKNALNMHHVAQGPLPSVVKEIVDIAKLHHDANKDGGSDGPMSNIFVGLKNGPGAYNVGTTPYQQAQAEIAKRRLVETAFPPQAKNPIKIN